MKLSIITVNLNNKKGLEDTIKSVISQLWQNFELLIIDGASTDNSFLVIKENEAHINYWVSEPDTGIYNAMNKGIKAAKGDYLLFLNSGDLLNGPTALNDFIYHAGFEGDIIYGDYKFENGGKIYPDHLTPYYFVKTSLPHQSTFFHKQVFALMGGYDENYSMSSDREFYLKCFLTNQFQFKHIKYPLTLFDLSGVSNNPLHLEKRKKEHELIFTKHFGVCYADYKKMVWLNKELANEKRKTIPGMLKRIKNKIKKLCRMS